MKPLPGAVRGFVRDAPVCRIATVRPDGVPQLIPVCPVFDGETLYVDIAEDGVSASGVRANGRVTVLIDEYHDDWDKLRAVVLRTKAEPIGGKRQEAAWRMIREKFPQYSSVDWTPRLTLALHIESWTQWGVMP
jgi:nitroimidazol reductase NimA-like FMN-containing flavoprotein (pyridoxamine 5'-phosphate oxidase superfamily)